MESLKRPFGMEFLSSGDSVKRHRDKDSLSSGDAESEPAEKLYKPVRYDSDVLDLSFKPMNPNNISDCPSSQNEEENVSPEMKVSPEMSEDNSNTNAIYWDGTETITVGESFSALSSPQYDDSGSYPCSYSSFEHSLSPINLVTKQTSSDTTNIENSPNSTNIENNPNSENIENSPNSANIENSPNAANIENSPNAANIEIMSYSVIIEDSVEDSVNIENNSENIENACSANKEHCPDDTADKKPLLVLSPDDTADKKPLLVLPAAGSPCNHVLKVETGENVREVITNDLVTTNTLGAEQVIDVENETFVDLTGEDDDDDDDDIKIVSVEEPILYLGSENPVPKKRRKHRRSLYDGGSAVLEESTHSEGSSIAGTSSSNRGRVRSPVLFQDLLDSTISIDDISEFNSPVDPPATSLTRRMSRLQGQSPSSLEQQVLNDLSDNPHSDEIARDLRNYEESLRQASRTLYDIQGREFSNPAGVSLKPSSNAGLLLGNVFFPASRLSIAANVNVPRSVSAELLHGRLPTESGMFSSGGPSTVPQAAQSTPRQEIEPQVEIYHNYVPGGANVNLFGAAAQPSTSSGKLQNGELACPICFEPFSDLKKNGRIMCSTTCGHMFCKTCLEEALRQSKQCPTCRKRLSKKQYHNIYLNFV